MTRGSENLTTLLETGNKPIIKITAIGYIQMRWYQHRTQGGYNITSLKKRLPKVATHATSQALNIVPQPVHDEQ
jgi:hypothetical protein